MRAQAADDARCHQPRLDGRRWFGIDEHELVATDARQHGALG